MISGKKGQAITEFVIIIPVMLMLLTGIYQFAMLAIDRIKLAMVEREVMMFLTEEDNKEDKWKLFGKETGQKLGLNPEKIGVLAEEETDSGKIGVSKGVGALAAFKGLDFKITYESELLPAFKLMTGKECIKQETRLVSAAGGCFRVELKKGLDKAFKSVLGEGASEDRFENENRQAEKEWKTRK
jgi:hypothetical protein